MKILVDDRISIRYLWFSNRGDTPHLSTLQDTNDFADKKAARHGQNQKRISNF